VPVTEAMLAQALREYIEQHIEEFEEFLEERMDLGGDVAVTWSASPGRQLLVDVTKRGEVGTVVGEAVCHTDKSNLLVESLVQVPLEGHYRLIELLSERSRTNSSLASWYRNGCRDHAA
jgi:hypothetical protein